MITTTEEYINVHQYSTEPGGGDCIHEGVCAHTDTYKQLFIAFIFLFVHHVRWCILKHTATRAHTQTHTHQGHSGPTGWAHQEYSKGLPDYMHTYTQ